VLEMPEHSASAGGSSVGVNVTREVVDGVPVLTSPVPGPMHAMLVFRVGPLDETLPTHGITHLVEHLALSPLMQGVEGRRVNGMVQPLRTRFTATGTVDEIVEFLGQVTQNLSDLNVGRIKDETKILSTEAANQRAGSVKSIWSWRYGARGLGLIDYEELGFRWLEPEHVLRWAATWFTAGNAVLWLSGEVPDGLRLNLTPGPRQPLSEVAPLAFTTPAMYQVGDRWAVHSMLGPRSIALAAGTAILDTRLRERLRHERSLSYDVHATAQRISTRLAEVTAFADSLAPAAGEVAETFAAVARTLAAEGPTPVELAAALSEMRRMQEHPERALGELERRALDELEGIEPKNLEQLDAEFQALTPQSIAAVFAEAFPTSLLGVPTSVPMNMAGFTPIPASSGPRIKGIQVTAMPGSGHADTLEYSNAGLSLTLANRTTIAIPWPEVAAGLWWSDGRLSLISMDGNGINVFPAKWQNSGPLTTAIRANVPIDRWVPMDEPDSLPRQEGPVCSICKESPAIEVTLQNPRSFVMIRLGRVHAILCRDCGIAKFREVQKSVLFGGWWSLPGLGVTPIALVRNIGVYQKFRKLRTPIRTSGIGPLPKVRPLSRDPAVLIPLGGVALFVAFVLTRY
jgi:zinc protease